ncbi:acyl-CoA dehydrogenase family protein [Nocardioides convexus]|uniref:acyl-CoA dehydrogenase family protein n=1 Tax=Nocardioides convexus TaxID=2712224 RepID=UPI0024181CBC|nr:acyl-CoA dehydrogenase family protein [Nocardioides convexus]
MPKENLLGEEGQGFIYLMQNLPQERISIATIAVAAIEHVLDLTLDYAKTREAFGKPIGKFQNTRFEIAEMATEAYIARVFVNHCIERLNAGDVDTALASMAKWWTTEPAEEDRGPGPAGCTAATATCWSTPSPRPTPTPGSRRSTAARPRSRRRSSAGSSASEAPARSTSSAPGRHVPGRCGVWWGAGRPRTPASPSTARPSSS